MHNHTRARPGASIYCKYIEMLVKDSRLRAGAYGCAWSGRLDDHSGEVFRLFSVGYPRPGGSGIHSIDREISRWSPWL